MAFTHAVESIYVKYDPRVTTTIRNFKYKVAYYLISTPARKPHLDPSTIKISVDQVTTIHCY